MKILSIDIGTGTQDILLYNSNLDMENNFKMVVPSPTMLVHRQIKRSTEHGEPILLSGVTMGGGPSSWSVEAHLRAGLAVFATPAAARTMNDDLEAVQSMGVRLVSDDEAGRLPETVRRIQYRDFDFQAVSRAFAQFGVDLSGLSAVLVGVFDHGNAPAGVSDRQFRFDYLDERIQLANRLSSFAFRAADVPECMTRLKAVVQSAAEVDAPLMVMDTAPAAVLGAMLDARVAARERVLVANIGNFHTLAFRMGPHGIEGLFEHHTGLIDRAKMERLLRGLADGSLKREDVFHDEGHGALVYDPTPMILEPREAVIVTGPRRSMFIDARQGSLQAYFPAPFGDMMICGCFGLLAAAADVLAELAEPIQASLSGVKEKGTAPWDSD